MRQLLDVMHEAVEVPLGVHLGLCTQREAIEALVVAQVRKHRLHRGDTPRVKRFAAFAVDGLSHDLRVGRGGRVLLEERHLACRRAFGVAQAACSEIARPAHTLTAKPISFV